MVNRLEQGDPLIERRVNEHRPLDRLQIDVSTNVDSWRLERNSRESIWRCTQQSLPTELQRNNLTISIPEWLSVTVDATGRVSRSKMATCRRRAADGPRKGLNPPSMH
jgi:hypothetical protein